MVSLNDRQFLCVVLRGAPVAWPNPAAFDPYRLLTSSDYHGVTALVQHQLKLTGGERVCSSANFEPLANAAHLAAAQEMLRRREIVKVLDAMAARGVISLIMKGTALAYWLYAAPELRQRSDTDVLIQQRDFETAARVFEQLGYERQNGVTGDLISSQATFEKQDDYAVVHRFDLHWRISNFHVFAEKLTFAELWRGSQPIIALGSHARRLSALHALLLACMHRLGHRQAPFYVDDAAHYDSDRLIWLYDIYLLAQILDGAQWHGFIAAARQKGLENICFDGLIQAENCFGAVLPPSVLASLGGACNKRSLSLRLFSRSRWRWELGQFWSLGNWRQRLRLLSQQLFPSTNYMLQKYRTRRRALLPLLYLRRAMTGMWKWL